MVICCIVDGLAKSRVPLRRSCCGLEELWKADQIVAGHRQGELEAAAAVHRADFGRERERCERLIAEVLKATAELMAAREADRWRTRSLPSAPVVAPPGRLSTASHSGIWRPARPSGQGPPWRAALRGRYYTGLSRPSTNRSINCVASLPDIILPIASGDIVLIILALSLTPSRNGTPGPGAGLRRSREPGTSTALR